MSEYKSDQGRDFDLLSTPLEGTTLIEASAGTGKTYTLTSVLLRLVAEHGLPIERILVVTFTEAATAELKEKIRTALWCACREIEGIPSGDRFLAEFAAGIQEPEIAVARLREAIASFDLAVICTIHGFCRRLLHDNAFESGSLFEIELEGEQKEVLLSVVEDFWRSRIYRESSIFISYLMDHSVSPEKLAVMLGNIPKGPFTRLIPSLKILDTEAAEARFISSFRKLKQAWMDSGREAAGSLEESGALKRNIYRPGSISDLVREMDAYFEQKELTMSLFKGFEKFTSSKIAESCKKGMSCPVHQFFDACEMHLEEHRRLEELFAKKLIVLKSKALKFVHDSLRRRRTETGKVSFDDLLLDVHDALVGPAGARFAEAVRDSFGAVLIDEFQDTDAVQWSIFKRIFHGSGSRVFMIGDPKQAIYGFRGADIFAYMRAAGESEARYTLRTNWRSEAGLLSAVNTLFSRGSRPFVFKDIPYIPSDPASAASDHRSGAGLRPFNIWFLRPESEKSLEGRKEARRRIADAVAGEITRLLESGRDGLARIGDEPLSERHIAVLVRTNKEAELMQHTLRSLGIPSVRHQTGNVFETREAKEIQRLLKAVAEPRDSGLLRAALSTDLLGMRGEDLIRLEGDSDDWEGIIDLFQGYNRLWHEQGFIRMMRRLLSEHRIVSRTVSMPGGERRATNLLHLSELLQQASAGGWTPEALLKWFSERIEGGTGEQDEHLIRLESDKEAVTLVTIHKSKGLEYPVVFCPFCWGESTVKKGQALTFHDPAADFQLVVDIDEKWNSLHLSLAEQEILAENLRLLYVALTRARVACYLVWGSIYDTGTSAPAWLFHRPDPPLETDVVEALKERCRGLSPGRMEEEVKQAAADAGENIEVLPLPEDHAVPPMFGEKTAEELSFRAVPGRIDSEWRLSSFSSLVLGAHLAPEVPDHDEAGPGAAVVEELEPGPVPFDDIFSFPRGARAGSFLHELLEHTNFKDVGKPETADLIRSKCEIHGFDPMWTDAVTGMLQNLVSTFLSPDLPGFTLSELRPEDRLNELEFLFPMARLTPDLLAGAFRLHQRGIPGWVPETIGRLQFPPAKGFMKGFIDMVFESEGRFYLVDWKSNFLGDKIEDYRRERLDRAMETGYYILQYHIYTLALDRYLALRIPGYRYRDHFGGVFYIFLRGVRREAGPEYGIFRDRPSEETIGALRECMLDSNPGQGMS
ncbi:MAG: exodeoxyribonuclease V subunit beta [Desulfatiglandaceae bacterium]